MDVVEFLRKAAVTSLNISNNLICIQICYKGITIFFGRYVIYKKKIRGQYGSAVESNLLILVCGNPSKFIFIPFYI